MRTGSNSNRQNEKSLGDSARSRIVAEIAKDYADRPAGDVEKLLVNS